MLLIIRREIAGNVSEIEGEALKASDGDISNIPIHMADAGTDSDEQEFWFDGLENFGFATGETRRVAKEGSKRSQTKIGKSRFKS